MTQILAAINLVTAYITCPHRPHQRGIKAALAYQNNVQKHVKKFKKVA